MLDPNIVLAEQKPRYQRLGILGSYPETVDRTLLTAYRELIPVADLLQALEQIHTSPEDLKLLQLHFGKTREALKMIYALIIMPDVANSIARKDKLRDELAKDGKKARKELIPSQAHAASFILGAQPAGLGYPPMGASSVLPPTLMAPPAPFLGQHVLHTAPTSSGSGGRHNVGVFPAGSCIFHPNSTTHSTAGCNRGSAATARSAAAASNGASAAAGATASPTSGRT
jgi:hypothetical protein